MAIGFDSLTIVTLLGLQVNKQVICTFKGNPECTWHINVVIEKRCICSKAYILKPHTLTTGQCIDNNRTARDTVTTHSLADDPAFTCRFCWCTGSPVMP